MILRLENRKDLDHAAALVSWLNRPTVERVEMSLPWLAAQERERAARALAGLFNDCGCYVGGPVFLVVLAASLFGRLSAGFSWLDLGASVLIAAAAAIAAKLLALAWSRWRLIVRLRRLGLSSQTASIPETGES